jgi:hypothetical protein
MARTINATDYLVTAARQWPQSALSISGLFLQTSAATSVPLAMYSIASHAYLQFIIVSDGQVQGRLYESGFTTNYIGRKTATGVVANNIPIQLGLTWTGGTTDSSIKIFADGVQVDNANDNGGGTFANIYAGSDQVLSIGCQLGGDINSPQAALTGSIAEVAVWDATLDAAEMAALGKRYSPFFIRPGNLLGYLPLIGRTSPEPDKMGVIPATLKGSTAAANHPRIIMPGNRKIKKFTSGAPAAPAPLHAQIWM